MEQQHFVIFVSVIISASVVVIVDGQIFSPYRTPTSSTPPPFPPRPGQCPSPAAISGYCVSECAYDQQCGTTTTSAQKCCPNGCAQICVQPAGVRFGTCPALRPGTIGSCIVACQNDTVCPAQQKCCFNGCGYTCQVTQENTPTTTTPTPTLTPSTTTTPRPTTPTTTTTSTTTTPRPTTPTPTTTTTTTARPTTTATPTTTTTVRPGTSVCNFLCTIGRHCEVIGGVAQCVYDRPTCANVRCLAGNTCQISPLNGQPLCSPSSTTPVATCDYISCAVPNSVCVYQQVVCLPGTPASSCPLVPVCVPASTGPSSTTTAATTTTARPTVPTTTTARPTTPTTTTARTTTTTRATTTTARTTTTTRYYYSNNYNNYNNNRYYVPVPIGLPGGYGK